MIERSLCSRRPARRCISGCSQRSTQRGPIGLAPACHSSDRRSHCQCGGHNHDNHTDTDRHGCETTCAWRHHKCMSRRAARRRPSSDRHLVLPVRLGPAENSLEPGDTKRRRISPVRRDEQRAHAWTTSLARGCAHFWRCPDPTRVRPGYIAGACLDHDAGQQFFQH